MSGRIAHQMYSLPNYTLCAARTCTHEVHFVPAVAPLRSARAVAARILFNWSFGMRAGPSLPALTLLRPDCTAGLQAVCGLLSLLSSPTCKSHPGGLAVIKLVLPPLLNPLRLPSTPPQPPLTLFLTPPEPFLDTVHSPTPLRYFLSLIGLESIYYYTPLLVV